MADSLFNSKIRCGLQLSGQIRWSEEDPKEQNSKLSQRAKNKMLRCIKNSKLAEKVSTQSMLDKLRMLSVNQKNAQVKMTEMWKYENMPNYPLELKKKTNLD